MKICKIRFSWSTTTLQTASVLQPATICYSATWHDVDNNDDDGDYGDKWKFAKINTADSTTTRLTTCYPRNTLTSQGFISSTLYIYALAWSWWLFQSWLDSTSTTYFLWSVYFQAPLVIKSCCLALCQWIALQQWWVRVRIQNRYMWLNHLRPPVSQTRTIQALNCKG